MNIPHPKLPKSISKISRHPRRWIVISIILLVSAIGIYGLFSYFNWRTLSDNSIQAPTKLKSLIDTSLGEKNSTKNTGDQITSIIADFDKLYSTNPCTSPIQFQWQTIIPAVQNIQKTCDGAFSDSLAVIQNLKDLSDFITIEQTSASSVISAINSTKTSTDYTASANTWTTLGSSFSSQTNNNFQPVADKIKGISANIATAYTAISTSLSSKNRTDLDTALSDLDAAYDSLSSISSAVATQREALTDNIIKNYVKL